MKKKVQIVSAISFMQTSFVKSTRFLMVFYLFQMFLLGTMEPVFAQTGKIQLSGLVKDAAGVPLPAVTVVIKGTNLGAITDNEGKYSLTTSQTKGILVFSFIGFQKEELPFNGSGANNVTLTSSSIELEQVVVVGYGTQKMKNVTGAISTINSQEISDLPVSNLGVALRGVVNGLSVNGGQTRPGLGAALTIRNPFSFSKDGGTTSPIYVIDDFIVTETAFNNLDANEVESISVLKDAAAAVFGARSSQGAVLVKTKRGKEGKPKVSFSSQFSSNDEFSRTKMLSAYDYGVFYNRYMGVSGKNVTQNPVTTFFQPDELATMKGLNYDWLDKYWKPNFSMKQNVNISGGSNNATYFASVSYFTQNGNLSTLDYQRWNYRAGADVKVSNHLKVSLQISGDYGERNQTFNKIGGEIDENDYNSLITTPKYMPQYVNGLPILRYGPTNKRTDNDIIYYNYDVVEQLKNLKNNTPTNMSVNSTAEYDFGWSKILNGLKLKVLYSKGINNLKSNQLGSKYTGYYFTQRSGTGNHLYEGDISASALPYSVSNGNRLLRDGSQTDSYQLNFNTTYERTFGKSNVSALFSVEKAESENEFVRYYRDDVLSFTNGQSNTATGTADGQTTRTESGILSYIGRLNYSYADKYFFEFLYRTDASTKFAPVNYWGSFPSFSGGWVISDEKFFKKNLNWMNFFKIRASLGFLGKDNTKPWLWRQRYTYQGGKGAVFGTSASTNMGWGLKMEAAPNYNATWDNSTMMNVGMDMKFLHNRLSVTMDGFLNKNINMLSQRDAVVPITIGGALAAENFNAEDSYGIELSMAWKDKISNDFSYYVRLNTGFSDSRWRKKDSPLILGLTDARINGPIDLGTWGYDYIGMFRTQQDIDTYVQKYSITSVFGGNVSLLKPGMLYYRDIRGSQNPDGTYKGPDGIIDENDLIQLSKKSSDPYSFTLIFGGNWKGLSLDAQIAASWGGFSEIQSAARYINDKQVDYKNVPSIFSDMFEAPQTDATGAVIPNTGNVNAKYPNMYQSTYNNVTSSFWQVSSFRMTLRTITLGYSVPKNIVNKIGVDNCRLTLTGMNVLNFFNPLPDKFTDVNSTYGAYPTLRNISLGINLSF